MSLKISDGNSFDYSIHYKYWHDDSDTHYQQMIRYHQNLLSPYLPSPNDLPVLDIGCGMGFTLLALQGLGFTNLCGIDIDQSQVESCRRRGLNVIKVDDTISFLLSKPSVYNLILMLDVLEHIPVDQQITFMRAVYYALQPGGKVILQVPNAASILASWQRYIDYTHTCSFTPISLLFVLKNAGFSQILIPGQGPIKRPSLRLWKSSTRKYFVKWVLRYIWRLILNIELGGWAKVDEIPVELNFLAVAQKTQ